MTHPLSRELCRPIAEQRFVVNKDDYILAGHLGDGAAGVVRKCTRLRDGSLRAVKFLAPDPKYIDESVFDDVASRFRREGERGAKLNHPHLLTIYAYCENQDGNAFESEEPKNPFVLMERIQGKTLDSYIRKPPTKRLDGFAITQERLHIAIQVANALHELHRMRLIHRDVKPANVFISKMTIEGKYPLVKLGDFGIVKWGDFHASLSTGVLTATNQKGLGTMKYMSPEQAISPKNISVRSDVYSLGITLFELFTGQILASPHHVYEILNARHTRGNTTSRFLQMGYYIGGQDEHLAAVMLDMFLRGPSGRPSIEKIKGNLETEYERRFNSDWESDLSPSYQGGFEDSWEE